MRKKKPPRMFMYLCFFAIKMLEKIHKIYIITEVVRKFYIYLFLF